MNGPLRDISRVKSFANGGKSGSEKDNNLDTYLKNTVRNARETLKRGSNQSNVDVIDVWIRITR